jgi:hypothetical protein
VQGGSRGPIPNKDDDLTRGVHSYDFLKLYGTYQNLKIWYFGYRCGWIVNFSLARRPGRPRGAPRAAEAHHAWCTRSTPTFYYFRKY